VGTTAGSDGGESNSRDELVGVQRERDVNLDFDSGSREIQNALGPNLPAEFSCSSASKPR
jgi:hypothetical protein